MVNEKMTIFLKKQLALLNFNQNCMQITNNSAFNWFSEQNGAKTSWVLSHVAQGIERNRGQNKNIFQSLSKKIKIKNIFLLLLHKLIPYFFLSFVLFSLKERKKRLRNKAFGSKISWTKCKNFLSIVCPQTAILFQKSNLEIRKMRNREIFNQPIDFDKGK